MVGHVDYPKDITVLSLCAGYGGLELGLAGALANRLRVVAVEIEAFALANLEAKAAQGRLAVEALWPDLRTFPAERFRGCFDLLAAGYPCQPHSCSGKRRGSADERWIWPDIARCIGLVRPEFVFLENVPGHLSSEFDGVLRDLDEMGFLVAAGLFSALESGVSIEHGRRLFVLGQAAGDRCTEARLSIRQGKSGQAAIDSGRSGPMVGPADGQGYERMRSTGKGRRTFTAEPGLAVAPQGVYQEPWEAKRSLEPRLGRAAHGPSFRVDRLRLLGNGVVPAQAELAFRALYGLLMDAIISNSGRSKSPRGV